MLKSGQFALVTNDCAVRKGETVELVDKDIVRDFYGHDSAWICWHNNMRVLILETHLTPIKAERWKPRPMGSYWYINTQGIATSDRWDDTATDRGRWNAYNVHQTEAEALAEAEATLADRKARLDK